MLSISSFWFLEILHFLVTHLVQELHDLTHTQMSGLLVDVCELVGLRGHLLCKLVQIIVKQDLRRSLKRQLEYEEEERSELGVLDDHFSLRFDRTEYLDAELDLVGNGTLAEDDKGSCYLLHIQYTILVNVEHPVHLLQCCLHLDLVVVAHVWLCLLDQGSHLFHERLLVNHTCVAILVESHLGSN